MLKPTEALVTKDGIFTYIKRNDGGWEAYINYDAMMNALPRRLNNSIIEDQQLDAKIELLNHLRNKK